MIAILCSASGDNRSLAAKRGSVSASANVSNAFMHEANAFTPGHTGIYTREKFIRVSFPSKRRSTEIQLRRVRTHRDSFNVTALWLQR